MKKILSTVLAGALIAGAAFADVSFDYTGFAALTGVSRNIGGGTVSRNDCLALTLTDGEAAGVTLDFDIVNGTKLDLDAYYGWLTFGVPGGSLQITTGKWKSRYVNRVNQDAGGLDAYNDYFEAYKPGSINSASLVEDVDNLTEKNMATVLAYTLNDVLPGTLMAKFGLVNADYTAPVTPEWEIKSGFVGELAYAQEDVIKANVAFKTYKMYNYAFGVFLSPLMVENLDLTLGFSMGLDTTPDAYDKYTDMGIDLRARYAVTEKLAVTTMHNYSMYEKTAKGAEAAPVNSMWNMLGVSYQGGDNIRFIVAVNNTIADFDAENGDTTFAITPACEITASDKVSVNAGFDIRWTNGSRPFAGIGSITIPVAVSVSL